VQGLGEERRAAAARRRGQESFALAAAEPRPDLEGLDLLETVAWDYATTGLSPRCHPLAPLREDLTAQGLPDARTLNALPDGSRVRYAAMVICRQRPGTAGGVFFMTLEDETGFVNLVVWSKVFEKNSVVLRTASFLGVTGKVQVKDSVAHLIAESFWTPRLRERPRAVESRDFH
jgi:error-prone DNA polymerase